MPRGSLINPLDKQARYGTEYPEPGSKHKKGGNSMDEKALTVEYKGELDPELNDALKAALEPFGYHLTRKGYDPKSRVRDLRFLRGA